MLLADVSMQDEGEMEIDEPKSKSAQFNGSTSVLPSLVPPLLALCQPTSLSFPPHAAASLHPPMTSALSSVHVCALECLNNIFLGLSQSKNSSISQDREGGKNIWNAIWTVLELVGTQFGLGQERRQEVWENAVGVLWGVGNLWKGSIVSVVHLIVLARSNDHPRNL
jgi:hypothetical protein